MLDFRENLRTGIMENSGVGIGGGDYCVRRRQSTIRNRDSGVPDFTGHSRAAAAGGLRSWTRICLECYMRPSASRTADDSLPRRVAEVT